MDSSRKEKKRLRVFAQGFGGGGRSRTYDAADMSRVHRNSNLFEFLRNYYWRRRMEASRGGKSRLWVVLTRFSVPLTFEFLFMHTYWRVIIFVACPTSSH
jgi:hypothetical protein